jgi:hypothetical protein
MSFDILNRWSGAVLYSSTDAATITATVIEAVSRGANLRGADLRGADLSDANLGGANLSGAELRGVKGLERFAIPDLPRRVAEAVLKEGHALKMDLWHACETSHCLAGWAVHLAGPAGYALESIVGTPTAGAMLMPSAAHLFYASHDEGLAWLKEQLSEVASK